MIKLYRRLISLTVDEGLTFHRMLLWMAALGIALVVWPFQLPADGWMLLVQIIMVLIGILILFFVFDSICRVIVLRRKTRGKDK